MLGGICPPPRCRPPGCRPPGCRSPGHVTCDACWEANPLWTEWRTLVKILPCSKLCLRQVMIFNPCQWIQQENSNLLSNLTNLLGLETGKTWLIYRDIPVRKKYTTTQYKRAVNLWIWTIFCCLVLNAGWLRIIPAQWRNTFNSFRLRECHACMLEFTHRVNGCRLTSPGLIHHVVLVVGTVRHALKSIRSLSPQSYKSCSLRINTAFIDLKIKVLTAIFRNFRENVGSFVLFVKSGFNGVIFCARA